MATNQALIHYALDLESPPLIACEAPEPTHYSTVPDMVTCPDCKTHEEFPRGAVAAPQITAHMVLREASLLISDRGTNPEYDRAIVELTSALIGAGQDDFIIMSRILHALAEGK